MANADLDSQLERLDEFSLPLLPTTTRDVRTDPARTAQLFLSQLPSDFRCVAGPQVDLADVETQRHAPEWKAALERLDINNRSVAVLEVGHYLDVAHPDSDLETSLKPWRAAVDNSYEMEGFETNLGPVVGPLVHLALELGDAQERLPGWASDVGEDWCHYFLIAGARELRQANQQGARYIHAY
ncbi:hypothetical protein H7J73_27845 [Mycolicibacterium komossense]|uniref:DUF1877 domain-containing protein n=2 Tax=Mycolicibacterium komossense TaxID=1779 RepID=A0ABT3CK62_9MYCO|nr:hypothetical protein [Mycolicibacterium komossense]